jgi:hypothetical protein
MDEKFCVHCTHFGTTGDLDRGQCPYCFLKDTILTDEYVLQKHECFTDDARLDGHS